MLFDKDSRHLQLKATFRIYYQVLLSPKRFHCQTCQCLNLLFVAEIRRTHFVDHHLLCTDQLFVQNTFCILKPGQSA